MNIDIIDFKIKPSKTKIASLCVKYYDLVINCELAFYIKQKKMWIRMPERWLNNTTKISFCFWPSKENSDLFQKEVLKLIFDKYNIDVDKAEKILKSELEKSKLKRKL